MTDWKLPWSAHCICAHVQMRITAPPMIAMACHCRGCQRLTSGPYSLSLMIPADGFAVEGETEIGGLHRPDQRHHFCAHCKNWLYTDGFAGPFVNVRATMLEDASWVRPYIESCIEQKLPGVVSGAKVSFENFPPPDQYAPLMEAYAREGARPA
ncbi:MAG: GFA family protein [Proteobacteria bacterium]|nr:GFA family protein [Pseudomonadota bacterium]